jgi:hypothetical protein
MAVAELVDDRIAIDLGLLSVRVAPVVFVSWDGCIAAGLTWFILD